MERQKWTTVFSHFLLVDFRVLKVCVKHFQKTQFSASKNLDFTLTTVVARQKWTTEKFKFPLAKFLSCFKSGQPNFLIFCQQIFGFLKLHHPFSKYSLFCQQKFGFYFVESRSASKADNQKLQISTSKFYLMVQKWTTPFSHFLPVDFWVFEVAPSVKSKNSIFCQQKIGFYFDAARWSKSGQPEN